MTDKERLIALLNDFGIAFECNDEYLKIETYQDKVEGYSEFYAEFKFDDDGKFKMMGLWE